MTVERPKAVVCDLLMAVMDSPAIWAVAAGSEEAGWAWRDGVTRRMAGAGRYVEYMVLVRDEAAAQGLPEDCAERLLRLWPGMEPRPDAPALAGLSVPYAFVTSCSERLAALAAQAATRAGLRPTFVLSAEEAGWYKPQAAIYQRACRRLQRLPRDVLYVAGAAYDAEGALAAGLRAALVERRRVSVNVNPAIGRGATLSEVLTRTF